MKRCVRCRRKLNEEALFCPACGQSQTGGKGDPIIGSVVGERYLIKELLGQGGSGTVYRAQHVGLNRPVAVKLLHHHLSNDVSAIERFRREAVTVAAIENDHIIDVTDFGGAADGRFFLVMELLEGITLADLMKAGAPPPDQSVDIILQAGEALTEAHALGYVHRDLRPRNIFLVEKKEKKYFVKLLDFGLSKLVLPGGDTLKSVAGFSFRDPVYLSPEQAKGEKVDRRTDIYSLAVILYHLLTGEPPFDGEDAASVLDKHLEVMPPLPSEKKPVLPRGLDAVLMKALAKNPESRYVTVFKFCEALQKAAAPLLRNGESLSKAEEIPSNISLEEKDPTDPPPDATLLGHVAPLKAKVLPAKRNIQAENKKPEPVTDDKAAVVSEGTKPEPVTGDKAAVVSEGKKPEPVTGDKAAVVSEGKKPEPVTGDKAAVVSEGTKPEPVTSDKVAVVSEGTKPEPVTSDKAAVVSEGKKPEPVTNDKAAVVSEGKKPEPVTNDKAAVVSEGKKPEAQSGKKLSPEDQKGSVSTVPGEQKGEVPQDPSMSQLWYAEGDNAQLKLQKFEEYSEDDEAQKTFPALYEGWKPGSRVGGKKFFFGVVGVVLVIIGVLLAVVYLTRKKEEHVKAGEKSKKSVASVEGGTKESGTDASGEEEKKHPEAINGKGDGGIEDKEENELKSLDAGILLVPGHRLVVNPEDDSSPRETSSRKTRKAGDSSPRKGRETRKVEKQVYADAGVSSPKKDATKEIISGRAALKRGDLVAAAAHFIKAKTINPRSSGALAGLGEVAFEQGRYSAAIHNLRNALKYSRSIRTMVLLGNAYFKAGKKSKAKEMYQKVLKRSPNHAEAKRNLELIQ